MNARQLRSALLASVLMCVLGALPAQASTRSEAGWNIGSALVSMMYTPVKVAYAAAGAVFGGIAWGLSGGAAGVAKAVIHPAVGGDYVVAPAHLRRERKLAFVGPAGGEEQPNRAVVDRGDIESPYGDDPYAPYGDDYFGE
jgi:hypothetical protein